jgi:hypothetical protein
VPVRNWWQGLFTTTDGDLSIARIQTVWGSLIVFGYTLDTLSRARAHAGEPPFSIFIEGLVILLVGGVASVMEARIERVPDIATWPALMSLRDIETSRGRYWLDVAVLQLALGALAIPLLSASTALSVVGWRLVTITIVSELVYLAFLTALLVQKDELVALIQAIRNAEKSAAAAVEDFSITEEERIALQKERKTRLDLLQRRASLLMRQQIGRTFMTPVQSD